MMKNFLFAIAVCALALLAGAACGSEERVDLRDALYQSVSTGSIFTCAVSTEGYLRCWGRNEGHEESGFTEAPGGTYRMVSSGYYGSCALKTDGQLKCWGRVDGKKPSDRFATIDVATDDVCGIRLDGSLHCWGRDLSGLSGYPEGTYTALSAGGGTACAIRSVGRPICWRGIEEWDYAGEIRNELSLGEFEAVSVGGLVLCGLRRGGEVDCWKGIDWVLDSYVDPPDGPFRSISVGGLTTCGVRPDGRVECWGQEYKFGGVPSDLRFRSVSASVGHACGITEDYRVVCWGRSYGP